PCSAVCDRADLSLPDFHPISHSAAMGGGYFPGSGLHGESAVSIKYDLCDFTLYAANCGTEMATAVTTIIVMKFEVEFWLARRFVRRRACTR
ncbi:MAG: hypothetical protein OEZ28_03290, partial [Nitrospinota bacterium]|nr:hypothetical protein [Nitrospinota bacterium]